jgi:hypothetical protein
VIPTNLRFLGLDTSWVKRVGTAGDAGPTAGVGLGMVRHLGSMQVVRTARRFGSTMGAVAAAFVVACSSTTTAPPFDGKLPLGTWGGDNSGMIVGDTAVHLHIGCTFGDVSGRISLDGSGQFDVAGSYMLRAYPITIGPSVPARFVGRVEGAKATITVTVNDTVEHKTVVLGPVVVTLGADPQMGPCPICRRPIVTQHNAFVRAWSRIVGIVRGQKARVRPDVSRGRNYNLAEYVRGV